MLSSTLSMVYTMNLRSYREVTLSLHVLRVTFEHWSITRKRKDERGSREVKMEVLGDMSSAEGKLG